MKRRKRNKNPEARPATLGRVPGTFCTFTKKVIGASVTLLGLATVIFLWPRVKISAEEELNKNDPMSAPFRVMNTSYYPITVKRVFCYADVITTSDGTSIHQSTFRARGADNTTLYAQGTETVNCPLLTSSKPFRHADIVFRVDYQVGFIPAQDYQRFLGAHGDRWEWAEQPLPQSLKQRADAQIAEHLRDIPDQRALSDIPACSLLTVAC
jgi:hypothetical protein